MSGYTLETVVSAINKTKCTIEEHKNSITELDKKLKELQKEFELLSTFRENYDDVKIAQNILFIRGNPDSYNSETIIDDFIQWLATGVSKTGYTPQTTHFSIKDYDRWSGQLSYHDYGYGPKHGYITFSIGLQPSYRKSWDKFTSDEKNACIFYLKNLKNIKK